MKLSAYEVGERSLVILKYKVGQRGIELKPSEFAQYITKQARLIGCPREELLEFFNKYLLPEILHNCEFATHRDNSDPNEREARIAYRLLKMGFFWDTRGLHDDVLRIAAKTQLELEEVMAIVISINKKHLRDEVGAFEDIKLEIDGTFELK